MLFNTTFQSTACEPEKYVRMTCFLWVRFTDYHANNRFSEKRFRLRYEFYLKMKLSFQENFFHHLTEIRFIRTTPNNLIIIMPWILCPNYLESFSHKKLIFGVPWRWFLRCLGLKMNKIMTNPFSVFCNFHEILSDDWRSTFALLSSIFLIKHVFEGSCTSNHDYKAHKRELKVNENLFF